MIVLGTVLLLLNATMIVTNLKNGYVKSWEDAIALSFYVASLIFTSNCVWNML